MKDKKLEVGMYVRTKHNGIGKIVEYINDPTHYFFKCYKLDRDCSNCEEYINNDDVMYVASEDKYICFDCIDNDFTRCEECDEYYHNENNEIRYCEECERYICADCMDFHGDICEECFDEKNAEREEA